MNAAGDYTLCNLDTRTYTTNYGVDNNSNNGGYSYGINNSLMDTGQCYGSMQIHEPHSRLSPEDLHQGISYNSHFTDLNEPEYLTLSRSDCTPNSYYFNGNGESGPGGGPLCGSYPHFNSCAQTNEGSPCSVSDSYIPRSSPPHLSGGSQDQNESNQPVTQYKWMQVKRSQTKSGKTIHVICLAVKLMQSL